ncbi:MAG: YfhO family protein [Clostridia bacterium]|nr:YfhO family protein [Clostridia bacterium]
MFHRFNKQLSDHKDQKGIFYVFYTALFCLVAFFVFSWFIFSGKSLIYRGDGWLQHYKALVYYAQYLRKIIKNLVLSHRLIIPDWDFYIGEGNDILGTLHYYVIGDPVTLLSVFVPTRFMHYFFTFSSILRLYLAGVAFSALCFGTGLKNRCGILAGAISYSFCSWAVLNAGRHPFFINPLIYFPLMILGVEKILRGEKPFLFILFTAISAASNFYFFYMIALLTAIYTFIRLFLLYKNDIGNIIRFVFKIALAALLGTGLSAVIFFPVLGTFLQESRLGTSQPFHWFYSLGYYSQLPAMVITKNKKFWLCLGYSVPVILSIFMLLLQKRRDQLLKVLFFVGVGIILFPIGGRIFNGMSYMTNRWVWAFALLAAYILAVKWESLLLASSKEWRSLFIFSVVYYAVCLLFERSRDAAALSAIPLFFISLSVLKDDFSIKDLRKKQCILLIVVIFSTVNVEFWRFSSGGDNYIAEFLENKDIPVKRWSNNETALVKSIATEEYPRYTGRSITQNVNLLNGISNTQYYWSLSNPYLNQFRTALAMRESRFYSTTGYDDRTTPTALSAAGYYLTKPNDHLGIPYGYQLLTTENIMVENTENALGQLKKELNVEHLSSVQIQKLNQALQNNYEVYENRFKLPLGYSYDSYITQETWGSLNPVQKQEIQLSAAVLGTPLEGLPLYTAPIQDYTVSYLAEPRGAEVSQAGNTFIATADNTQITLRLEKPVKDAEVYVGFDHLEFKVTPEYDLYFGPDVVDPLCLYNKTNWHLLSYDKQSAIRKDKLFLAPTTDADITVRSSAGVSKVIQYMQPDSPYSSGRHDFIVNLGYTTDEIDSLTITLPKRGIYSFSSLKVYRIPMDGYAQKIEALSKDALQNVSIGVDCVQGDFSADSDKILCMAIPYSKGWSVYVDGQKQDVLLINSRHIGTALTAGRHTVQFEYRRPLQQAGLFISTGAAVLLLGFIVISEKKRRFSA